MKIRLGKFVGKNTFISNGQKEPFQYTGPDIQYLTFEEIQAKRDTPDDFIEYLWKLKKITFSEMEKIMDKPSDDLQKSISKSKNEYMIKEIVKNEDVPIDQFIVKIFKRESEINKKQLDFFMQMNQEYINNGGQGNFKDMEYSKNSALLLMDVFSKHKQIRTLIKEKFEGEYQNWDGYYTKGLLGTPLPGNPPGDPNDQFNDIATLEEIVKIVTQQPQNDPVPRVVEIVD